MVAQKQFKRLSTTGFGLSTSNRCAAQLTEQLSHSKKSNPLLEQVDLPLVMDWLKIKRAEIALVVLKAFAASIDHEIAPAPAQHVVLAGSGYPKRVATDEEQEIAAKMLAVFNDGEGSNRPALAKAFPAHQHIISWLFDARKLQTSPDGYVFTSEELDRFTNSLGHAFGAPAPSVRDIKDKLELGRKKAEQLRSLLVSQKGSKTSNDGGAEIV